MKEKTVTSFELHGSEIEIKSRREEGSPSGWAVIAFTPSCSIRSTRLHSPHKRRAFAQAIVATTSDKLTASLRDIIKVEEELLAITLNHDT